MHRAVLHLLVAAIIFYAFNSTASAGTAYVAQPQQPNSTTLVQALSDSSVSQILLLTNYSVNDELDQFKDRPLQINRSVSISGAPGLPPASLPVLDLRWKRGKLALCSSCVFEFKDMVVANERQGVGPAFDVFVGRPGSVVATRNIYRLRLACTSAQYSSDVVSSMRRSAVLPGSSEAQQQQTVDATYQGRSYPGSLFTRNLTADIPFVVQEGRGPSGGYAVGDYNMTRLCVGKVDDDCLQRMSPEACRRRQQQQQLPGPRGCFKQGSKEVAGAEIGDSSSSADKSTGNTIMRGPLGGNKPGWELTASRTASAQPQGDAAAAAAAAGSDARIDFGELIGSGSYGMVYKARWAGRQVAVKVIEHDTSAAAAVTNEIQLLLSFNHPNIVKAHHYATYTQISSTATGSSSGRWAETWLVTEYCDLGTLHHVVRTMHEADHPPPGQLLSVKAKLRLLLLLRDAAQGLQALHAAHTVHGDLNSRNVLVASSASSPCGMTAKLADLGLSRVLQQHATHRTTQTVGTMSHMAPEVLRSGRLSAASDIYSFGIMLHTVFTGEEAFRSLHYGQFFQTVVLEGQRPPVSVALPGDVLMLMERCWAPDPADRPSADRLLELLGFLIQVRQQNLAPRIS
ncbi:hypothetical protein OEZ86_013095 [Tetradesmus obliquus]|nr:hypothetical protein OEZ86_013095 [Tetradesmus obliquus]